MRRLLLFAAILVPLAIPAPLAADTAIAAPANPMCPVLVDEKVDPDIYVDYQGKRVWLCCARCKRKFIENPTAYLAALPQFKDAVAAQPSTSPRPAAPPPPAPMRLVRFAGRFHPLAVHFPIGLMLAAAVAEGWALLRRSTRAATAAQLAAQAGGVAAVAAAALGWGSFLFATYPAEFAGTLSSHRWVGTGAAGLALITALLATYAAPAGRGRTAFRVALALAALAIGIAGHLGGTLVWGFDHFTW